MEKQLLKRLALSALVISSVAQAMNDENKEQTQPESTSYLGAIRSLISNPFAVGAGITVPAMGLTAQAGRGAAQAATSVVTAPVAAPVITKSASSVLAKGPDAGVALTNMYAKLFGSSTPAVVAPVVASVAKASWYQSGVNLFNKGVTLVATNPKTSAVAATVVAAGLAYKLYSNLNTKAEVAIEPAMTSEETTSAAKNTATQELEKALTEIATAKAALQTAADKAGSELIEKQKTDTALEEADKLFNVTLTCSVDRFAQEMNRLQATLKKSYSESRELINKFKAEKNTKTVWCTSYALEKTHAMQAFDKMIAAVSTELKNEKRQEELALRKSVEAAIAADYAAEHKQLSK
jgi:hypothetical protein